MAKIGIDISAYQGDIDLEALKDQIDFVIIRVGFGVSGTIDNKFKRNASLCERLGIPYGFYWYSYALNIGGAQVEADNFLKAIAPYNPTMGCWFDMEDADGYKKKNGMPSNAVLREMCYSFCEIVERAGYYAGIYASLSWFKNQLAGDRLDRFDKWVAYWPTSGGKQRALAVDPSEYNERSMWQFTSAGRFAGYNGNLDTNYAYVDFPNPKDKQPATEPEPTPTPAPVTPQGSVFELALGVMQGKYGNGDERVKNLGTRYDEVQEYINHIFAASVDTLAKEVIEGKYGVGDQRKLLLGGAYDAVQAKVNQILGATKTPAPAPEVKPITKGCKIKFTGTKSYSGIQLASWTHNDTFNVIEISNDRVVIGKGSAVTAAVNIKDCQKV